MGGITKLNRDSNEPKVITHVVSPLICGSLLDVAKKEPKLDFSERGGKMNARRCLTKTILLSAIPKLLE